MKNKYSYIDYNFIKDVSLNDIDGDDINECLISYYIGNGYEVCCYKNTEYKIKYFGSLGNDQSSLMFYKDYKILGELNFNIFDFTQETNDLKINLYEYNINNP